jgi:hypothetical protein
MTPRAVYNDGTHLDLTEGVRYEDIDRARLASFCLVQQLPNIEKLDKQIEEAGTLATEVRQEMVQKLQDAKEDKRLAESIRKEYAPIFNSIEILKQSRIERKARAYDTMAEMMRSKKTERIVFTLQLQEGQRLIWRKRVISGQFQDDQVWHLVGWQKTVGGENIQCISYFREDDGVVIMAGQWEGEHVLLGDVQLLDFE